MFTTSSRPTCTHVCPSFLFLLLTISILMGNAESALTGRNMRIQPLGDSITFGYLSSDGNGYRNDLLQRLIFPTTTFTNGTTVSANTVLFIGSAQGGNMTNNANEGHDGAIISQIATYANLSLPERPNVVLLHAGTNDMTFNVSPDTAPDRISSLIDQIHTQCPDALILLAKILNAANNDTEARLEVYNAALPGVVSEKVGQGLKVQMVDMTGIPVTMLQDGLHPTDQGYDAMAQIWYEGLIDADSKGWIGEPVETNVTTAVNSSATATITPITSVLPSASVSPSATTSSKKSGGVVVRTSGWIGAVTAGLVACMI